MDEEAHRRWDIITKIASPILTVAGILVGVWQFSSEQSAQLQRQNTLLAQNDKLDFKRRMWEKQLDVYMKISNVVGRIATSDQSKDKLLKDIDSFYTLYWGDMIYVEDAAVEKAMIDFHIEVQDYLEGRGTKDRLKIRANEVVGACRKSSKETWFAKPIEGG